MAIFADVVDEWKKASGKEKLLIAGGGAAVVALALYLHNKSSSSQPTGTGTTGVGGSFQPSTGGTSGTTSNPPPNDGGNPLPTPGPGPTGPPTPTPSNRFITVGKDVPLGTTLQQIATQFGLSMQQLAALNPWAHIGQAGGYDTNSPGNIDNLQVNLGPQAPVLAPGPGNAPSRVQPNTTMQVYAQTRHAPAVIPAVSKQRAG